MIAPLKPGVTPAQANGPVIETERLLLRQWQGRDMAPYAAMLSDPGTARFITVDGKPVVGAMTGWRHAVVMAGHWVLHGAGMFVVEKKSSGKFAGRVGPWKPPGLARIRSRLGHRKGISRRSQLLYDEQGNTHHRKDGGGGEEQCGKCGAHSSPDSSYAHGILESTDRWDSLGSAGRK